MIVFNALAIVVAVIIGVFVGPLFWLFPDFMDTTWGEVTIFIIVTAVGIITDMVGLKGRIFWLPIWLFGVIGMGWKLYEEWGWWGPGAAVGAAVLLFAALLVWGRHIENKEWAEAPSELMMARDCVEQGQTDKAWEHLQKAYFVPAWMDYSEAICRHNLDVLPVVREQLADDVTAIATRVFEALEQAYQRGLEIPEDAEKKLEIPGEITAAMEALIEGRGAIPEDSLEELNKALGEQAALAVSG